MATPSRLDLFTIRNAFFAIGPAHEAMVFTAAGEGVREACMFSAPARQSVTSLRIGEIDDTAIGDVFLGFDGAWNNWFHWICFALAKSAIAARLLSPGCRIVLP